MVRLPIKSDKIHGSVTYVILTNELLKFQGLIKKKTPVWKWELLLYTQKDLSVLCASTEVPRMSWFPQRTFYF